MAEFSLDINQVFLEYNLSFFSPSSVPCSSASAYPSCSDWTPPGFGHCKDTGRSRDAGRLTLSSRPPHLMKQPHVVPSMHIPEYSDFSASASAMPPQASEILNPVKCELDLTVTDKSFLISWGAFQLRHHRHPCHSTTSSRSARSTGREPRASGRPTCRKGKSTWS